MLDRVFFDGRCLLCDELVSFKKKRYGHFQLRHHDELKRMMARAGERTSASTPGAPTTSARILPTTTNGASHSNHTAISSGIGHRSQQRHSFGGTSSFQCRANGCGFVANVSKRTPWYANDNDEEENGLGSSTSVTDMLLRSTDQGSTAGFSLLCHEDVNEFNGADGVNPSHCWHSVPVEIWQIPNSRDPSL